MGNVDVTPNADRWQLAAAVLEINDFVNTGTLLTYGEVTEWNGIAGKRVVQRVPLTPFCGDAGGFGKTIGLAITLTSSRFGNANASAALKADVHYSANFALTLPLVQSEILV